jgi:hypothetical protein
LPSERTYSAINSSDGGRHPALDQNWPALFAAGAQQREILHASGTDLDHVAVLDDQFERGFVERLRDHRDSDLARNVTQNLQPGTAESLERVRRRPRLVRAAAQDVGAGRTHRLGDRQGLIGVLDRAGPGNHREVAAADRHAADADHRRLVLRLATDQLVGVGDRDDFEHPGQALEQHRVERLAVAGDADRDALGTRNRVGAQAERLDPGGYPRDVLGGRPDRHDDQHRRALIRRDILAQAWRLSK